MKVSNAIIPIPPPAPVNWNFVNLPTTFNNVAGGFLEDFEAAAGVIPAYMAITELETLTMLPNPNVWANIGQQELLCVIQLP